MTYWKILGAALAGLALLAAIHIVAGWRDDAHVLKACMSAVAPNAPIGAEPGKACPATIAADHLAANRARACDAAFSARPENAYRVASSCSTPVKTVQAERDVARREAKAAIDNLNQERLGQDAAITRASASATALAERKARAASALHNAPRDGDGLVVCDAQCMRERWGVAESRR